MSSQLKSLIFPALALLLVSTPAFSQVTGVNGIVKDENGKPVAGATVTFERTDIKGHYEVKTKKKGDYGHYGLPIGTYTVTVTIDGKVRDTVSKFPTHPGDPAVLNFDLKATADSAKAMQKAAETGTLTQEQERSMTKEQKEAYEKSVKAKEASMAKNKALNDAYTTGKNAVEAGNQAIAAMQQATGGTADEKKEAAEKHRAEAQKQFDAAIESLNKAAEMDPKQGAVWATMADAYIGKVQANPAEASADYDKAFDAYKKAIEISPTDAGLYNNYALNLAKDKKLDEAKTNLAKAAELDPPGAGKYYYNLGALLVNSGQNDAALDEFKKAVAADPDYADAQYQYGVALSAKATTDASGKIVAPAGAVDALQKYLDLKPDGANAQSAKEMIAALGAQVSTNYSNPAAGKGKANTKKTTKQP